MYWRTVKMMLQQQLWQQQKNIGCQFCDPKTEIGKVTEFHKKKSKRLDVIEEKLMGGANLAPPPWLIGLKNLSNGHTVFRFIQF